MIKRHFAFLGLLAYALAMIAGCDSSDDSKPLATASTPSTFTFATAVEQPVRVLVSKSGSPAQDVTVKIVGAISQGTGTYESRVSSGLYLNGRTNDEGWIEDRIVVLSQIKQVDVIAIAPGFTGPWTDASLQTELGPLAPASRITLPVSGVGDITINLEAKP